MYRALVACGALVFLALLGGGSGSQALFAPAPVYQYAPPMTYAQVAYMPEFAQPEFVQPEFVQQVWVEEEDAGAAWTDIAMLAVCGVAIGGAIGVAKAKARGSVKMAGWDMQSISPDGSLVQRIEGHTRKTWKFTDTSKDRVQVALGSEGRPVHADIHLWLGPNYTPFSIKAYSEDGKLRPIQCLVGTKKKEVTVEVKNVGESDFPIKAASNYAVGEMQALPIEMPATTAGERVDGQALRSYPLNASAKQLEVILNTEGRQLKARVELLNAPNNPKQTFEVYASDGQLTSLCVCFDCPDEGNTVRILNLSPVEFPLNIHLNEK